MALFLCPHVPQWYTNVPEMSPSGDGETLEW
nr:MAG TPA: hypothetical protein [Caudoviricetes sp.]